jgi:hypothetical protein
MSFDSVAHYLEDARAGASVLRLSDVHAPEDEARSDAA